MAEVRMKVVLLPSDAQARNSVKTVAILRCDRTERVQDAFDLRKAFRRAVTRWVRETIEGREALKEMGGVVSVEHLIRWGVGGMLKQMLDREGVCHLDFETQESFGFWHLDEMLLYDDAATEGTHESEQKRAADSAGRPASVPAPDGPGGGHGKEHEVAQGPGERLGEAEPPGLA